MAGVEGKTGGSTVIPGLKYRDAHRAIDWLVKAFGFKAEAVYDGPHGTVAHAQLTLGRGMIMLGSDTNATSMHLVHPQEVGNRSTVSIYLVVQDAGAVFESAKAAGAEILAELEEKEYGGRGFGCRDLEGHNWSVGEYDPWAQPAGE